MHRLVFVAMMLVGCGSKKDPGPSCEQVVDHMLEITKQQLMGHDGANFAQQKKAMVEQCEKREMPKQTRVCILGAKTITEIAGCRGGKTDVLEKPRRPRFGSGSATRPPSGSATPPPIAGAAHPPIGSAAAPQAGSTTGSAAPNTGSATGSAAPNTGSAPKTGNATGSAAPKTGSATGSAAPKTGSATGSAAPKTGSATGSAAPKTGSAAPK